MIYPREPIVFSDLILVGLFSNDITIEAMALERFHKVSKDFKFQACSFCLPTFFVLSSGESDMEKYSRNAHYARIFPKVR